LLIVNFLPDLSFCLFIIKEKNNIFLFFDISSKCSDFLLFKKTSLAPAGQVPLT